MHEGKHLLPGTYFKRFIANGGAPRDTSLLTHYECREILFMSFTLLSPFARHRHLRILEAFMKNREFKRIEKTNCRIKTNHND